MNTSPANAVKPANPLNSGGFTVNHSPVKCSPEEIEMKRQTALKKRSLRLANKNQHRKS